MSSQSLPIGSKLSIHNGQLLTSTGVSALDQLLGGGLPIGSVFMIKEDETGVFSECFLKHFTSQGLACRHDVLHVDLANRRSSEEYFQSLPMKQNESMTMTTMRRSKEVKKTEDDEKMKIAWRYEQAPRLTNTLENDMRQRTTLQRTTLLKSTQSVDERSNDGDAENEQHVYCHNFDMSKRITQQELDDAEHHIHTIDMSSEPKDSHYYNHVLASIRNLIEKHYSTRIQTTARRNILRISIRSLGTYAWSPNPKDMLRFLHALRGIVRFAYCIVTVTIPPLFPDHITQRVLSVVDASMDIRSLDGSEPKCYQDFHALIQITKLVKLNAMVPSRSAIEGVTGKVLSLKCKKTKMVIETIHLPPELGEEVTRSQGQSLKSMGCSSTGGSALDF